MRIAKSLALVPLFGAAFAGPTGGVTRAGAATITSSGSTTTITQTSDRAVIDWRTFNSLAGDSIVFAQPGAQSAILNRVTGTQLSSLQGTLTANGQVYLINPNGILVGSGSSVSAAGFVASTANIGTSQFMTAPASANGRYAFDQLTPAARGGSIVNAGTITVSDGGLVALVAPSVQNSGAITARVGRIELASASYFTLDLFGDDLVRVAVGDTLASGLTDVLGNRVTAQIKSSGQLLADGGRIVLLSVPAAASVVDSAINLSGVVRARRVVAGGRGDVLLLASDGVVTLGGTIDAAGGGPGLAGGSIAVFGRSVQATAAARLDASGAAGGGLIALGGSYDTAGAHYRTAQVSVANGATLSSCGTATCSADGTGGSGTGGTVRLYSVQGTQLAGRINASAGAGSIAGTVEVLSDQGATSLTSTARISAVTGTGLSAGFVAVVGESLTVDSNVFIDLRDYAGFAAAGTRRLISDNTPGSTVRAYVFDPVIPQRQTEQPLLFHAYANAGNSNYQDGLPQIFDAATNPGSQVFSSGEETPVGTLRPNGGAPSTLSASGADALTAIPIALTAPVPAGSQGVTQQVADLANHASDQSDNVVFPRQSLDEFHVVLGGPGVGRSADLGRRGDLAGASAEVFDANQQVLAPAGTALDADVTDYLCRTPYDRNSCAATMRR